MKILLLSDANSAHTRKWCEALRARGAEVGVFSLGHPRDDWFGRPGMVLYSAGMDPARHGESSPGKIIYLKALPGLRKAIRAFGPDIVHAHYATSYGLLGALNGFRPYVVSSWGSDVAAFPGKSFLHRTLLKYVFRKADRLFVTSAEIARVMRPLTAKKPVVTPFGIDVDAFSPGNGTPGERLTVGTVKSLERIYRMDVLIRAFQQARINMDGKHLTLLIVGEGSEHGKLADLVRELKLEDAVSFRGYVDPSRVASCHQEIDIFVNVPEYESFGVSVLESMACGNPVVVSRTGGLKDLVTDKVNGLVVEPGSVDETARAITTLARDPALRGRLGREARKTVQKHYDMKKNMDAVMDHYRQLAGQEDAG